MNFEQVPVSENTTTENNSRVWRSLCFQLDQGCVVYITKFSLIASVVSFCFFQLINLPDCESQNAYLSVLTLILGCFLPTPNIRRN